MRLPFTRKSQHHRTTWGEQHRRSGGAPRSGRLLLKGGGVIAAGFLLWLGLSLARESMSDWDFFRITAIAIDGCSKTSQQELQAKCGVDLHSNLVAVDTELVARALGQHPLIDRVKVKKDWPNRLSIVVREKEAVALINRQDGLFYLDRNGEAFWPAATSSDLDFPVVSGPFSQDREGRARLDEALSFLDLVSRRKSPFLPEQGVSEIQLSDHNGLILYLVEPPFPIVLGQGEIEKKYERLVEVLTDLYQNKDVPDVAGINMTYSKDEVLVSLREAAARNKG